MISRCRVLYKLLYQASHGGTVLPCLCGFHCCMPLPATSISALRFGLSVVQRLLTLWKSSRCAFLSWWMHSDFYDFYIMSIEQHPFFLSWSHAADPVVGSRAWRCAGQFSTWSLIYFFPSVIRQLELDTWITGWEVGANRVVRVRNQANMVGVGYLDNRMRSWDETSGWLYEIRQTWFSYLSCLALARRHGRISLTCTLSVFSHLIVSCRALALPLLPYRFWVLAPSISRVCPPQSCEAHNTARSTTDWVIGRAIRALLAVTTGCWRRRWRGPAQPLLRCSSAPPAAFVPFRSCAAAASLHVRRDRAAPVLPIRQLLARLSAVPLSRPFARDPPKPALAASASG